MNKPFNADDGLADDDVDFCPSQLVKGIAPSPTITITQVARAMKASGRDVISLSAGEPDFDTPPEIVEAATAAMRAGQTRYTAVDGTPQLKASIREKFRRDQKIIYAEDEVTATAGGKMLVYLAMQASLNPGDEVIIPAPYWVSYPDIVQLARGTPVIVETPASADFILTPEQLKAAITAKTRWLFLNSPGNPTGAVYTKSQLEGLAEVLRDHPWVWVMADDIYEHITFETPFHSLVTVAPDLRDRILLVNGASKAYAMTGWRLGFGAGPAPLMTAIRKLLGQTTSNLCSITQAAGVAALDGDHSFLTERVSTYRRRRDLVVSGIDRIDGLTCAPPQGAFYAFPSCAGLIGKTHQSQLLDSDVAVAKALLESYAVATVPGTGFGLGPHLRLSYATSDAQLNEAISRIETFVGELE